MGKIKLGSKVTYVSEDKEIVPGIVTAIKTNKTATVLITDGIGKNETCNVSLSGLKTLKSDGDLI